MSQVLQQLKTYLETHDYDEESKKQIEKWEKEMAFAVDAENLGSNTTILQFIEGLQTEMEWMNDQLKDNRTLKDKDRNDIFDRKELYTHFISLFTGDKVKSIETSLTQILENAQK